MNCTWKRLLAGLLCTAVVASLAACATGTETSESEAAPESTEEATEESAEEATEEASEEGEEVPETEAGALTPGTYEGEAIGNGGTLRMAMTIDDSGKIADIEILSHWETEGIRDVPFERVVGDIIGGQTLAVDSVSGATVTSNAIKLAAEDCLTQAGADISAMKKRTDSGDDSAEMGETVEKTADVIIIGGGGAGLAAAITATDNGASVIILEKTAIVGGNTLVCGGIYNAPDPELQEPEGIEDSPEFFAQQTWEEGDQVAIKELVDVMCFNAYDGYVWLKDLGLEFEDKISQGAGSLWPRTHGAIKPSGTGYIEVYMNNLSGKDNFEILMETEGKELMVDEDGKVVGVKAFDIANNNEVILNADNAVILATGGFAANVELRQKYAEGAKWKDLGPNVMTTNVPGVTGDGILMAESVGAELIDMDQIQLLHLGNPRSGATTGSTSKSRTADEVIFVNKEGNRFVAEDDRRDVICNAILEQPDAIMYIIHDSQNLTTTDEHMAELLKMGTVQKGETLEELAAEMGVPAENLVAAVEGYNAAVESGTDEDQGRTLLVADISVGPFYAIAKVPSAHHTMGGVHINTSTQVLREDGTVIEGLLAAGEVVGGIHGGNRLGGNAVVDTVVFGRIAGETAAAMGE